MNDARDDAALRRLATVFASPGPDDTRRIPVVADPERNSAPVPTRVAPTPAPEPDCPSSRLPAAFTRAWDFTRDHATAVGVVLLAGCLWACYSITNATPAEIPAAAPTVAAVEPAPVAAEPAQTPIPQIEVHVLGGVRKPGVVSVPDGSRVQDVLEAAGGLADNGDPGELNLAAKAVDGSQIVIGTKKKPRGEVRAEAVTAAAATSGGKVSLNSANAAQLEALPGVGPVTAQHILAWRKAHGKFTSLDELQEVDGIGPKTFANLADYVQL
ncbi:MAG: ComEA family DNA-binding protein [Propionibacteriaceae bacterium]|jgi:competence protein ComEA|nr:ComEA family DNA-binding protein [Propionibacteriaceae bacterium]